jgi:hypothetical protein
MPRPFGISTLTVPGRPPSLTTPGVSQAGSRAAGRKGLPKTQRTRSACALPPAVPSARFANEYGRLGTYYAFGPEHGEPFDEWQRHHRWMSFLAQLRTECARDRPQLDQIVRWEGDDVVSK